MPNHLHTDLHSDPFGHQKPVDYRSENNPVGHHHFHRSEMPVHLFIDAAKTFFFYNDVFSIELERISVVSNPKGGNQAPSTRIRHRCLFSTFSTSINRCRHL